jgi:excisionase family DNA binding protein
MSQPSKHHKRDIWQNEMLTVVEVATYLRISRVTVWRWCKQGLIPAIRVGRGWRIHRDDLLLLSKPSVPELQLIEPSPTPISEENFHQVFS